MHTRYLAQCIADPSLYIGRIGEYYKLVPLDQAIKYTTRSSVTGAVERWNTLCLDSKKHVKMITKVDTRANVPTVS